MNSSSQLNLVLLVSQAEGGFAERDGGWKDEILDYRHIEQAALAAVADGYFMRIRHVEFCRGTDEFACDYCGRIADVGCCER